MTASSPHSSATADVIGYPEMPGTQHRGGDGGGEFMQGFAKLAYE
jgi:hypothetical protein